MWYISIDQIERSVTVSLTVVIRGSSIALVFHSKLRINILDDCIQTGQWENTVGEELN